MLRELSEKKIGSMKQRGHVLRVDHGIVMEKLTIEGRKTKWFGIGIAPTMNKAEVAPAAKPTKPVRNAKASQLAPKTRKSAKKNSSAAAAA